MNKRMRELLAQIETKKNAAEDFIRGNADKGIEKDITKGQALIEEMKSLQAEFEAEKALYETNKEGNTPSDEQLETNKEVKGKTADHDRFMKALRAGLPKATSQTEGVDADGGYVVPEDISTLIEHYKEDQFSLKSLVRVIPTKTNEGARTFKSRSTQTGFQKVSEMGAIQGKDAMTFNRVNYKIEKFGGYLPVSNELLQDTDQALQEEIVTWLGNEGIATENAQILAVAKTFTAKTLTKAGIVDEIKTILNVDLGQAFKPTATIVTNDSGLNVLDTLKDADGRYLLQASPVDPMKTYLCVGTSTVPVVVIPDGVLANDSTKIPFFIGDLMEAVAFFDRQTLSLKASDTASVTGFNAFENDCTLWRALLRLDVEKRDEKALYFAELDTAGE